MFLPNFIKIDPYNFELYRFKLGAFFLRHSVYAIARSSVCPSACHTGGSVKDGWSYDHATFTTE